ncbi:MAG TPA: hypothetical protein VH092_28935 [Urbifossiella sp.]|nr:hypothetical protein [Urbifossiella sp.]
MDNRLELPARDDSSLLQEWDPSLGAESAFARVAATLRSILAVDQPVDSLERPNRRMAAAVGSFRKTRPIPARNDEGEVFVISADRRPTGAKGIRRTRSGWPSSGPCTRSIGTPVPRRR